MSPRTALTLRAGALAAGLALTLSACSAAGVPGAAVVVDGEVVPERDVQTVVSELPAEITGGAPVPTTDVVTLLMLGDVARELAAENTGLVSTEDVERQLQAVDLAADRPAAEYSEPTLEVLATNEMIGALLQSDGLREEFLARVNELDVEVNPRYGTLGEDGIQILPVQHEWLADTAAPEA